MRTQRTTLFHRVLVLLALFGLLFSSTSAAAGIEKRTLELKLGGSEMIKTPAPFTRVAIANPDIADVVVLSTREIYIYGKKLGFTSMVLWEEDKEKTVLDVVVSLEATALKKQLYDLFPNEKIEVYASETGVVLSGTVSGPEVMEEVLRLTRTFLPKTATGSADTSGTAGSSSGLSGSGITNLLKIGGLQQVMLEVTFAEVNKDSGRDLQVGIGLDNMGSSFKKGAVGTGPLGVEALGKVDSSGNILIPAGTLVGQAANSLLLNFAGNTASSMASNAANIFVNIEHFTAALQFLESEGLARTLAEPRLVTQTGKEASFLAGGEFPIPVADQYGNIRIEYKPFGVALGFTPVVMSDGKISLHVVPSVSSITGFQQATVAGGTVPILSTRNLETTVELYDGQTLALAGLLQDNMRESVRKIPFLGDIPILGALFRSTGYTQDKTDLMIAVTPHLIKPVPEGSIKFPGAEMQIPNRYEFYLEGKLEGARAENDESAITTHAFPRPPHAAAQAGGLEGNFGYQPVKAD
jgi:pilus assembly protein CpaC